MKMNLKENLRNYIAQNLNLDNKDKKGIFKKYKTLNQEDYSLDNCQPKLSGTPKFGSKDAISIKDFINEHEEYSNFQTMLFKLIDERNLKDADVYNKVHLDRRLFSKIRSDKNYHPSKETIILLGLALELNETELDKLLDSASYSLPKNNNYDLIIRFCFINKIFKLTDINELLSEYNCKLFSY